MSEQFNPTTDLYVKPFRFYDHRSGREMIYVYPDTKHWTAGWLCYKHPYGQFVTLRKATNDDLNAMNGAIAKAHHTEAPAPAQLTHDLGCNIFGCRTCSCWCHNPKVSAQPVRYTVNTLRDKVARGDASGEEVQALANHAESQPVAPPAEPSGHGPEHSGYCPRCGGSVFIEVVHNCPAAAPSPAISEPSDSLMWKLGNALADKFPHLEKEIGEMCVKLSSDQQEHCLCEHAIANWDGVSHDRCCRFANRECEICAHCNYSIGVAKLGEFAGQYVHVLTGNVLCSLIAKPAAPASSEEEVARRLMTGTQSIDCNREWAIQQAVAAIREVSGPLREQLARQSETIQKRQDSWHEIANERDALREQLTTVTAERDRQYEFNAGQIAKLAELERQLELCRETLVRECRVLGEIANTLYSLLPDTSNILKTSVSIILSACGGAKE